MRRPLRYLLAAVLGAAIATVVATALATTPKPDPGVYETSVLDGVPIESIRPTGVGLPLVGAHGTVGASDYAASLKTYHDDGTYAQDLKDVDAAAKQFLKSKLQSRKQKAKKCKKPHSGVKCPKGKPGLVLDIDETSLSNYSYLAATDFSGAVGALATALATATSPAIGPTLKLYNWAQDHGVAVFFITGRPGAVPGVRDRTEANLTSAGYADWQELHLNDDGEPTKEYKSSTRAEIEDEGYKIIANVGDQESDLSGGHAVRGFKLPNPYYFIGDE
jgi:hypothetical protein